MKPSSKDEIRFFIDKMSEAYHSEVTNFTPGKMLQYRLRSGELFGLIIMYVGMIPLIMWNSNSGVWNPLAISLCLICIAVGGGQVTLKQIKAKPIRTRNL